MHDFLRFKWSPDFRLAFPVLLAVLLATLAACGTTGNPVAIAETVEQKAFALYGVFVVSEETGADLMASPTVPVDVKRAIQDADAKAKPIADEGLKILTEAQAVRAQWLAGETTVDRLNTVTAALEAWLLRAGQPINTLATAVSDR